MDSLPNPNSDSNPTTKATPSFSPASLLWAHQLRREHNTLVSRLDALEEALASASAGVITRTEELRVELDKRVKEVGGAVGVVKGEIEGVKREIDGLNGWRGVVEERERENGERRKVDEEGRRRDREERERRGEEVETGLKEILEGVRGLKGAVEEMRREREEQIERGREAQRQREREREGERERKRDTLPAVAAPYPNPDFSDNEPFRSSSLPPIPHFHSQERRQQQHRIPSTISGTPTITHLPSSIQTRSSLPPQAPHDYSTILVPDSIPPAPPSSHADQAPPAAAFPTSPPQPRVSPITQSTGGMRYGDLQGAQSLHQGPSESLESYFARGETVLSASPRREENRAVLAFWEGVGDERVKRGLKEELEREGWRWEVVRGFMMEGGSCIVVKSKTSGCENGSGAGGEKRKTEKKTKTKIKMKKRRAIPVIWPVDEEEGGWLVVQNGLT